MMTLLLLLLLLLLLQVMSFESEAEMLKRWTSLVLETDPDIITGDKAASQVDEPKFDRPTDKACLCGTMEVFNCACRRWWGLAWYLATHPATVTQDRTASDDRMFIINSVYLIHRAPV
jgi:hypothetical protein